jgi:hypothetical protein
MELVTLGHDRDAWGQGDMDVGHVLQEERPHEPCTVLPRAGASTTTVLAPDANAACSTSVVSVALEPKQLARATPCFTQPTRTAVAGM